MIKFKWSLIYLSVLVAFSAVGWYLYQAGRPQRERMPRIGEFGTLGLWWEGVPRKVRSDRQRRTQPSNITRQDYVGPESCRECHEEQHAAWSEHPHRWMNAYAKENVVGDFSGKVELSYLGGKARFFKDGDQFRMELSRDGVTRLYGIEQTIGSRFTQYYVGKMLKGPEPTNHDYYTVDHVLPLGYWIDAKEWVPIVHVDPDSVSGSPADPFAPKGRIFPYHVCNVCHTTFPLGDDLIRKGGLISPFFPKETRFDFATANYLRKAHPDIWQGRRPGDVTSQKLAEVIETVRGLKAPEKAVTLGISCEACHLGAKAHADGKLEKPLFFPQGDDLYIQTPETPIDFSRSGKNVNWICARCHVGRRPQYANGVSTWNSIEYTDASNGGCYSQMTCIDCHNPHKKIGPQWTATPTEDDASCLRCHDKYEPDLARTAHTHHPAGSKGSRCMNCHMPRINEGIQDMVRTHHIFSPTEPKMIQANHPNACNMCHPKQNIDWTLKRLKDWYGKSFDEDAIAESYPDRSESVGLGWLKNKKYAVRLVAADSLFRAKSRWALPQMIDALDDSLIINRQFASRQLERMMGVNLLDKGYRFYMTKDERREPLRRIRETLIKK